MFFSGEILALINFLYIIFFFLIEAIIPLFSQGFDFSFNSAFNSVNLYWWISVLEHFNH